MKNGRRKGKVAELEFAKLLTAAGFPARRGQQFKGTADSPDVVCESLPIRWEVKRREKTQYADLLAWVEQANAEAGVPNPGESWTVGCVAFRGSRQPWLVTMRVEDLLWLLRGHKPRPAVDTEEHEHEP